jgi:hypothetical protein
MLSKNLWIVNTYPFAAIKYGVITLSHSPENLTFLLYVSYGSASN